MEKLTANRVCILSHLDATETLIKELKRGKKSAALLIENIREHEAQRVVMYITMMLESLGPEGDFRSMIEEIRKGKHREPTRNWLSVGTSL